MAGEVVEVDEGVMVVVEAAVIMVVAVATEAVQAATAVAIASMAGEAEEAAQEVATKTVDVVPLDAEGMTIVDLLRHGAEEITAGEVVTMAAGAETTAEEEETMAEEARIMAEGVVVTTTIGVVEIEVGTTEEVTTGDMVAESGVLRVVTVEMPEVIAMGLQAPLPRASLPLAGGSTPAALAPATAATPLVRAPPPQVASV